MTDQPLASMYVRIRDGSDICVPTSVRKLSSYVLLEQEDWLDPDVAFVRRVLRPGQIAWDIGAGYGVYTMAMARGVGPGGRVVAFEPNDTVRAYLTETLRHNGVSNVELREEALADRAGQSALRVEELSDAGTLVEGGSADDQAVETRTLDALGPSAAELPIDLLKIDVDGGERAVLDGAEGLLARQSPLILINASAPEGDGSPLAAALEARGFRIYRFVPGLGALAPYEADRRDPYWNNLYAAKPDRAARLAAAGLLAEAPSATPDVPANGWRNLLIDLPYFDSFRAQINKYAPKPDQLSDERFRRALDNYAFARDVVQPIDMRWGALQTALALLTEFLDGDIPGPQALSLIRVAADYGFRQMSANLAITALNAVNKGERLRLTEAFLAPTEPAERRPPNGAFTDWLKMALFEAMQTQFVFSSYFTQGEALPFIDRFRQSPFYTAALERRRQLMRMAMGQQSAPEPHNVLAIASADNLNPVLWQPGSPIQPSVPAAAG